MEPEIDAMYGQVLDELFNNFHQARCRRQEGRARTLYLLSVRRHSLTHFERAAGPERVFVERIRRGAELLDATPETVLRSGDVVAIAASAGLIAGVDFDFLADTAGLGGNSLV